MSFLDDIKQKVQGFTKGHEEQVEKAVDKGNELAKEKFGHSEQVDTATNKAKEFLGGESRGESAGEQQAGGQHAASDEPAQPPQPGERPDTGSQQ